MVIHTAGNDFKKAGPRVKGHLILECWSLFQGKIIPLSDKARKVVIIHWEDYDLRKVGFIDTDTVLAGQRFDSMGVYP